MKRGLLKLMLLVVLGLLVNVAVTWCLAVCLVTPYPGQQPVDQEGPFIRESTGSQWWVQVNRRPGATFVIWEPTVIATRQFTDRQEVTIGSDLYEDWRNRELATFVKQKKAKSPGTTTSIGWTIAQDKEEYLALIDKLTVGPSAIDVDSLPGWARNPQEFPYTPSNFACEVFSAHGWPLSGLWYEAVLDASSSARTLTTVAGGWRLQWPYEGLELGVVIPLRVIPSGFAANTVLYVIVIWLLLGGMRMLRGLIRARRGLCPRCAYPLGESPVCSECGESLSSVARVA